MTLPDVPPSSGITQSQPGRHPAAGFFYFKSNNNLMNSTIMRIFYLSPI